MGRKLALKTARKLAYASVARRRPVAKKGPRVLIKMRSTESSHMYLTEKNRRNDSGRLELKKYDPVVRRHVIYREAK
jgi:large subunit ribosomal protein L33